MEAMTLVLDDREWTLAERDALPDDGCRYELIDGALVVTPSPVPVHQAMVGGLYLVLRGVCPQDIAVYLAPLDVFLDPKTAMQPDLLVVRRTDVGDKGIVAAPVLAVEVLSPSTQMVDRNLKFQRFERAQVPSYWLLDPRVPALMVYELRGGAYELAAQVEGDQSWTAALPFPVTISPRALLD